MSRIFVDIENVRTTNNRLRQVLSNVGTIRTANGTHTRVIASSVLDRKDLRSRLTKANRNIADIENRIEALRTALNDFLRQYERIDWDLARSGTGARLVHLQRAKAQAQRNRDRASAAETNLHFLRSIQFNDHFSIVTEFLDNRWTFGDQIVSGLRGGNAIRLAFDLATLQEGTVAQYEQSLRRLLSRMMKDADFGVKPIDMNMLGLEVPQFSLKLIKLMEEAELPSGVTNMTKLLKWLESTYGNIEGILDGLAGKNIQGLLYLYTMRDAMSSSQPRNRKYLEAIDRLITELEFYIFANIAQFVINTGRTGVEWAVNSLAMKNPITGSVVIALWGYDMILNATGITTLGEVILDLNAKYIRFNALHTQFLNRQLDSFGETPMSEREIAEMSRLFNILRNDLKQMYTHMIELSRNGSAEQNEHRRRLREVENMRPPWE